MYGDGPVLPNPDRKRLRPAVNGLIAVDHCLDDRPLKIRKFDLSRRRD
jgi:hypothetical protein